MRGPTRHRVGDPPVNREVQADDAVIGEPDPGEAKLFGGRLVEACVEECPSPLAAALGVAPQAVQPKADVGWNVGLKPSLESVNEVSLTCDDWRCRTMANQQRPPFATGQKLDCRA